MKGSKKTGDEDTGPMEIEDVGERMPIEHWSEKHAVPVWLFRATKLANGWAIGAEITEKKFTEAVAQTAHGRIG